MTPNKPPHVREAQLLAALEYKPDRSAADLATVTGLAAGSVASYLRGLEYRGLVTARLETLTEAHERINAMPRRSFVRRTARRVVLYRKAPEKKPDGAA